jgi:hypothetical protein
VAVEKLEDLFKIAHANWAERFSSRDAFWICLKIRKLNSIKKIFYP